MAYRSYFKTYASSKQADVEADLVTWMQAQGWTLEDTISATAHVLSSTGEAGTMPKGWLHIFVSGSSVAFKAYTWYDVASHTGYGESFYSSQNAINCSAAGSIYYYGSKDLCFFRYGTQRLFGWGHWPSFGVLKPRATLSGGISAGSNVVVALDNTDRFYVNDYYMIADFATGCRERVQVNAVNAGVSVTLTTLVGNYTAGSIIGYCPSTFGIQGSSVTYYWERCVNPDASGTAVLLNGCYDKTASIGLPGAHLDYHNNLYGLKPIYLYGADSSAFGVYLGVCDAHFLCPPDTTADNLYGVMDDANQYIIGTASAGGSTNLDVAGTPFTEDALIGKILVLTGGTGAGQSRYITDNTTSRIVVGQAWATNPNATTTFAVVDRLYRNLGTDNSIYICAEEKIGEP